MCLTFSRLYFELQPLNGVGRKHTADDISLSWVKMPSIRIYNVKGSVIKCLLLFPFGKR